MRAASILQDLLSSLFDGRTFSASLFRDAPIEDLCRELLSSKGEVATNKIAAYVLAAYRQLDDAGKKRFFEYLNNDLDLNADEIIAAAEVYRDKADAESLGKLTEVAEPRRQELFRRLNHVQGATAEIVAMRTDLLDMLKTDPALKRTDLDLRHLLFSWFNRGFLVLRQISWSTPANILEKIIKYEAVHAINDWDDLRRRLQPADRRCFAFFHPAIPDDPLVFVEVALVKGTPGSIQDVLSESREPMEPGAADTAVFYSISNCQVGLRGISFGNSLIKQVAEDLSRDLPHIKNFVTLSPVPGFNKWLATVDATEDPSAADLLTAAEASAKAGVMIDDLEALSDQARGLCARYLTMEKRGDGMPLDPVARFHLGNGAMLHAVHAGADTSKNGLKQSSGVMVNYLYDLRYVEASHEAFVADGVVNAADSVHSLARKHMKKTAKNAETKTREAKSAKTEEAGA